MSALRILSKLLSIVPKALNAADAIAERFSRRPPPPAPAASSNEPSTRDVELSEIYQDEHSWTRFGPHLPPQTCIYCRQPITTASRYCPGVPRDS